MKKRAKLVKESLYDDYSNNPEQIGEKLEKQISRKIGAPVEFTTVSEGNKEYGEPLTLFYSILDGGPFSELDEDERSLMSLAIEMSQERPEQPESFYFVHDATPVPIEGIHSREEERMMTMSLSPAPTDYSLLNRDVAEKVVEGIIEERE